MEKTTNEEFMNAQDIVQSVYKAEKELASELAEVVNKKLAELSEETGLMLGSVTLHTIEATAFRDKNRKWVVTHASIESWLPDKIATGC